MALHRLDKALLRQGPGAQHTAAAGGGQLLQAEIAVGLALLLIQGMQRSLQIHGLDGFTALPARPEQLQ
jgi:hypothetical protein